MKSFSRRRPAALRSALYPQRSSSAVRRELQAHRDAAELTRKDYRLLRHIGITCAALSRLAAVEESPVRVRGLVIRAWSERIPEVTFITTPREKECSPDARRDREHKSGVHPIPQLPDHIRWRAPSP
jgi:hypothetical protein